MEPLAAGPLPDPFECLRAGVGVCASTGSAELRVGLGDDVASAFARGGSLASLCGLLIIWPLIVVVTILVKVKMRGEEI